MAVKPMEHTITDRDNVNVVASNGVANIMSDIYTYRVPRHTAILLRPEDALCVFIRDATAESAITTPWELVARDPNGLTVELLAQGIYAQIREFQDRNRTRRLGRTQLVKSDFLIAFRARPITVLTVAQCYFTLSCLQYAETL